MARREPFAIVPLGTLTLHVWMRGALCALVIATARAPPYSPRQNGSKMLPKT
ncbi:hypothetical protein MJC1_03703 [Methylocystis sp. MJC1]|nr:hypothetical protein MJC1_03703 [Methylocystis sp. MJC1]